MIIQEGCSASPEDFPLIVPDDVSNSADLDMSRQPPLSKSHPSEKATLKCSININADSGEFLPLSGLLECDLYCQMS